MYICKIYSFRILIIISFLIIKDTCIHSFDSFWFFRKVSSYSVLINFFNGWFISKLDNTKHLVVSYILFLQMKTYKLVQEWKKVPRLIGISGGMSTSEVHTMCTISWYSSRTMNSIISNQTIVVMKIMKVRETYINSPFHPLWSWKKIDVDITNKL